MNRRDILRATVAAPILASLSKYSFAADWPTREITVVQPVGVGGDADLATRALMALVQAKVGAPVIVKNMPGSGGALAIRELVGAKPDGYTMSLVGNSSHITIPRTVELGFDPMVATTMVAQTFTIKFGIAVAANSPIKSIADLIAEGKQRRVNYSADFVTNAQAMFQLAKLTGASFNWVRANSGPEGATQTAGGHVDACILGITPMLPLIQSGALRLLASASESRLAEYPDVPTLREQGYDAANIAWLGFAVPAGVPEEIRKRLETAMGDALKDPELNRQLLSFGVSPSFTPGPEFQKKIKELEPVLVPILIEAGVIKPK